MMERQDRPVSDWQLERYLLRESPASELADLDRRMAADPELARRLAALKRSDEDLNRALPARVDVPADRAEAEAGAEP